MTAAIDTDLVLDGNALGGLLAALFGSDMTALAHTCVVCGETHEIGRHRLYRSAGFVLRCPSCGEIAVLLAELPDRVVMQVPTAPFVTTTQA